MIPHPSREQGERNSTPQRHNKVEVPRFSGAQNLETRRAFACRASPGGVQKSKREVLPRELAQADCVA